jgi:cysteine synthase
VVLRTQCCQRQSSPALTGAEVYVKYENLQVTNSFKDRGALVKLASLSDAERARGVITMSAGNHAQAVAYHAQRLRIPATIVMPVTTAFREDSGNSLIWCRSRFARRDSGRSAVALRTDPIAARASARSSL